MSELLPAPEVNLAVVTHNATLGEMEATASQRIVNNAETARIESEHAAAIAEADARRKAAEAELAAKNADQVAMTEQQKRATDANLAAKNNAIERRRNSAEVSALNDRAEFEIFGSKGRTLVDPETGAVVATPEKPLKGKLEEISNNPKYGKTQFERDANREIYEEDLKALLDEGFELCQAKLVLDLREADMVMGGKMLGNLVGTSGLATWTATEKVDNLYMKKDAARLDLIKKHGVYTADDYKLALKGHDKAIYKEMHKVTDSDAFKQAEQRAADAKASGNWTEYQKAMLAMAELADKSEEKSIPLTDEEIAAVDSKLDMVKDGRIERVERDVPILLEPVTETSRKGLRARFSRIFAAAHTKIVDTFGKDNEKHTRNRLLVTGIVLGAAAVGAALLYNKYGLPFSGGSGHGAEHVPTGKNAGGMDLAGHPANNTHLGPDGAAAAVRVAGNTTDKLHPISDAVLNKLPAQITSTENWKAYADKTGWVVGKNGMLFKNGHVMQAGRELQDFNRGLINYLHEQGLLS